MDINQVKKALDSLIALSKEYDSFQKQTHRTRVAIQNLGNSLGLKNAYIVRDGHVFAFDKDGNLTAIDPIKTIEEALSQEPDSEE